MLYSALLSLTDLSELQNKNKVCSFLKQGSVWGGFKARISLTLQCQCISTSFNITQKSVKVVWSLVRRGSLRWKHKRTCFRKSSLREGGGDGVGLGGGGTFFFSVFFWSKVHWHADMKRTVSEKEVLEMGCFVCVCVCVCVHPCARMHVCACVFWVKDSPTCKYEMTGFRKHGLEELFCFAGFLGQGFIDMDTWLQSKQSQGREISPRGEMVSHPGGHPSGVPLYPNIMLQLGDKQRALSQHCHRQWRRLSTSVAGFLQTCIATISLLSVFSSNTLINEMQLVTHNWECQKNKNHKRKASQNPDNNLSHAKDHLQSVC